MAFTRVKTWSDDEAFTATSQEANFKKLRSEINRGLASSDIYVNATRGTTNRYFGPKELKKLEVSKTGPSKFDIMAVGCSGTTAAVCNDFSLINGEAWSSGSPFDLVFPIGTSYNGLITNLSHPRIAEKSSGSASGYLTGEMITCLPKTGVSFYLEKSADCIVEFWYQPAFIPDSIYNSSSDGQQGGLTSYIDAFAMYRAEADTSWAILDELGTRIRSNGKKAQMAFLQHISFHIVKENLQPGWHHICLGAVSDYQLAITGTTGVIVESFQSGS